MFPKCPEEAPHQVDPPDPAIPPPGGIFFWMWIVVGKWMRGDLLVFFATTKQMGVKHMYLLMMILVPPQKKVEKSTIILKVVLKCP